MSKIIDANMHWLPGDLFSDAKLLNAFLDCVPKQYGSTPGWSRLKANRCAS